MPPPKDDEERRRRDPLASGPGSGSPASQAAGAAPPPSSRSAFSLRSPTQPDFHHHSAFSSAPAPAPATSANANSQSRSILHSPYATPASAAASLPPGVQLPPVSATSSAMAPRSPPRGAPLSVYYPHEVREAPREQSATGSFYDPTTDTTTTQERRVSDAGSWQNASTPKVGAKPFQPLLRQVALSCHSPLLFSSSKGDFYALIKADHQRRDLKPGPD